jgi:glucosyl-dolichyl phosphate glucuronosyltransferase
MPSSPVLITVSICTWNRCALLRQTLEHMTQLVVPAGVHWELLVVENACNDQTRDVASSFTDRLPIRLVSEHEQGLSHARNRALDEARGHYIVFTDDDVITPPDWLCQFWEGTVRHPDSAVFGGPVEPWFPVAPPAELLDAFPLLRHGFCGTDHPPIEGGGKNLPIFGANMGFVRSSLVGYRFDTKLGAGAIAGRGGEETELVQRLERQGLPPVWLPKMTVKHYVDPSRMSLEYLCSYYEGRGGTAVRFGGYPPGVRMFGLPRWLLRRHVEATARRVMNRLVGRRQPYLHALREYYETRGMIRECIALQHEAPSAHGTS